MADTITSDQEAAKATGNGDTTSAPSVNRMRRVLRDTGDEHIKLDETGQPCLDISIIRVGPERGRKEFTNILRMKESMEKYGFFSVVVVCKEPDGTYSLIAGERRFRAFVLTGERYIPFKLDTMTPLLKKEIELEENINRENLSMAEECDLRYQVDKLKREIYGDAGRGRHATGEGWSIAQTAALFDESPSTTHQKIKIGKRFAEDPELRQRLAHLPLTAVAHKIEREDHAAAVSKRIAGGELVVTGDIIEGHALEQLAKIASATIDLVVTDPPFGMRAIEQEEGTARQSVTYTAMLKPSDNLTPEAARDLLGRVIPELARVLKRGAHLYMFFAFEHYTFLAENLARAGFLMEETPIIWFKGRTTVPNASYMYCSSYEPILFCHNKERLKKLHQSPANVIQCPIISSKKKVHPFQKPAPLLAELIRQSSQIGDIVLDPFAGSGETVKTAKALQRNAIGFEVEHSTWATAQLNLTLPLEGKLGKEVK